MSGYRFPEKDVEFIIRHLLSFDNIFGSAQSDGLDSSFMMEVLDQAQRFGRDTLAPLYRLGDLQPATVDSEGVHETAGFAEAYREYQEGGWVSLSADPEFGGQGLPNLLAVAVNEIVHVSAGTSFGVCAVLGQGAIHALSAHGSDLLKQRWLPRMVSGEWTGTMNLTEPAAGSDLAAVQTKAVPEGDDYRIFGQKIFITWGDHQMTKNIVHLVLARLPDAPAGVKGISLFLVPKFLLDDNGNIGERNDVKCISIEHKLGLHASPTCTIIYGDKEGAIGYLVGEPHNGLAAMFTMMNQARQAVGLEGLAVAEASYQQAREFTKERIQGTRPDGSRFAIFEFPDVKRMLMQMKASIEAMRALTYLAGFEEDQWVQSKDDAERKYHDDRNALLTPIVKAWCTELAQEVTYLGIQIHGGMGFVEETGAAQHYRDARVLAIYEGTTGIQALDFIGRKIQRDKGQAVSLLLDEIAALLPALKDNQSLQYLSDSLSTALASCRDILTWMLENSERRNVEFVSVSILMAFGYVCGGWVMARSALKALELHHEPDADQAFLQAKLATCAFYSTHLLSRVQGLAQAIVAETGVTFTLDEEQF